MNDSYIDKKLKKIVDKAIAMFHSSGVSKGNISSGLSELQETNESGNTELDNVSDMLSKLLGKDLNEKDQMEFKIGLVELIDSVESKYIEDSKARGIINKVILALLMRFKGK